MAQSTFTPPRRPDPQPPSPPAPTPPPPPLAEPLLLTADEQRRLDELRAKGDGLSDEETAEVARLERRVFAAAQGDTASRLPPDDAARLATLRAERDNERTPPLSDKDSAELQKLSAAESVAAGHVLADPSDVPEVHPHVMLASDILGIIERMIDKLPAFADLAPSAARMRGDIARLSAPEKK